MYLLTYKDVPVLFVFSNEITCIKRTLFFYLKRKTDKITWYFKCKVSLRIIFRVLLFHFEEKHRDEICNNTA